MSTPHISKLSGFAHAFAPQAGQVYFVLDFFFLAAKAEAAAVAGFNDHMMSTPVAKSASHALSKGPPSTIT